MLSAVRKASLLQRAFTDLHQLGGHPSLLKLGFRNKNVLRNITPAELYQHGLGNQPANPDTLPSTIASSGAMCAYSAKATGRTPKAKRIVKEPGSEKDVNWGSVNIPLSQQSFEINRIRALDYLNMRPKLFVVDGYAGWDPRYRFTVRVICSRAYHALFMHNMLIRPTKEELARDFSNGADYHIINAGEFPSNELTTGVGMKTCVSLHLGEKQLVILGTQYAGEMKKGVFTVMHYEMPKRGVASLHASANEGPKGDVSLFFGLSGTGKTTLSADPQRALIGDDEHCWTDNGVYNIEGGCYAKCVGLKREKEPEIYDAIRFGSVLENIKFHPGTRDVNFDDISITENTRLSYPLEFIPNAKIPAIAGHAKNVIFLTCDAYGVLPPVSKLTPDQAMYHFIAGYTAKVAGTEVGIKEPQPTFSACFGEAFLIRHPSVYAELLAAKIKENGAKVWLVNSGWTGGKYGVGKRMDIKDTRKIIDAIHSGELDKAPTKVLDVFGLQVPTTAPGVNPNVLMPKNTWTDKADYDATLRKLGGQFIENFKKYEAGASAAIKAAGPHL